MDLSDRRILVIGLGKTGVATARFLAEKGSHVIVVDEKNESELQESLRSLGDVNVELKLGVFRGDMVSMVDLVVPSPGVPPFNSFLMDAREKNIPIVSELELAFRFLHQPIIAITGTNGKTTTTKLTGEILKNWGKKVFVGGNIGNPLIEVANKKSEYDYLVVEVSSFQLQWIESFHPFVAVLLNMSDDHLDYHGTFAEYRRMKERLFENQSDTDLAILNADDPTSSSLSQRVAAPVLYFSSSTALDTGMFKNGSVLRYRLQGERDEEYPLREIRLKGNHNLENCMASILAARRCGCPSTVIRETLQGFRGLPHRMEFSGELNGIEFYNDSKGTNVDAVARALESFSKPVILLLGGRNKGGDFTALASHIGRKVRHLIIFGEARDEIVTALGGIVETTVTPTLEEAANTAWETAQSGDVVLLSPGCASFDEFRNYEERGTSFKESVQRIIAGNRKNP